MLAQSRFVVSCPREVLPLFSSLDGLFAFTAGEESAETLRKAWMQSLVAREGLRQALLQPVTGLSLKEGRLEVSDGTSTSVFDFTTSLAETLERTPIERREYTAASVLSRDCSVKTN
jgi:hypothetical protein